MLSSHKIRPRQLSATVLRTINLPGRYEDGCSGYGLSLLVKPATPTAGSRSSGRRPSAPTEELPASASEPTPS